MNELTGSAPTQVLCRHSGRCCFSRAAFQKSDQVVIPLKNPIQPKTLPVFSLCLGLVGLVLQIILLSTGLDEKGLLITGSLPEICSWILTGCSLLILLLGPGAAVCSLLPPLLPSAPASVAQESPMPRSVLCFLPAALSI